MCCCSPRRRPPPRGHLGQMFADPCPWSGLQVLEFPLRLKASAAPTFPPWHSPAGCRGGAAGRRGAASPPPPPPPPHHLCSRRWRRPLLPAAPGAGAGGTGPGILCPPDRGEPAGPRPTPINLSMTVEGFGGLSQWITRTEVTIAYPKYCKCTGNQILSCGLQKVGLQRAAHLAWALAPCRCRARTSARSYRWPPAKV